MEGEGYQQYGFYIALAIVLITTYLRFNRQQQQPRQQFSTPLNRPERPIFTPELPKAGAIKVKELTPEQIRMHEMMPQKFGHRVITIVANDILVASDLQSIVDSSRSWFVNLCRLGDVYVLCRISNLEAKPAIVDLFPQVPKHKILFFENEIGKKALVRQLDPQVHIENQMSIAMEMCKHLTSVVYIGTETFPETKPNVKASSSLAQYFS